MSALPERKRDDGWAKMALQQLRKGFQVIVFGKLFLKNREKNKKGGVYMSDKDDKEEDNR